MSVANDPARKVLSVTRIKQIFNVISEIFRVNVAFLQTLRETMEESQSEPSKLKLGKVFLSVVAEFKIYSVYVNNYSTSILALDQISRRSKWKSFYDSIQDESEENGVVLSLSSLLI